MNLIVPYTQPKVELVDLIELGKLPRIQNKKKNDKFERDNGGCGTRI